MWTIEPARSRRWHGARVFALALGVAALPSCASLSGAISGQIKSPPPEGGEPIVAYAVMLDGAERDEHAGTVPTVRRMAGSFEPLLSVVAAGESVRFLNRDGIQHRFFSSSEPNAFDLGALGPGEWRDVRFDRAGPVRFYCSLHEDERGLLFVAPTRHFATAEPTGDFEIAGLAPGEYELRLWHERLPPNRLRVTVYPGRTTVVEIAAGEVRARP